MILEQLIQQLRFSWALKLMDETYIFRRMLSKMKPLNIMEHEETTKHAKQCMSLAVLPKEYLIEDMVLYNEK